MRVKQLPTLSRGGVNSIWTSGGDAKVEAKMSLFDGITIAYMDIDVYNLAR